MFALEHAVGDHHALGFAGRTAGVLQNDQPFGVMRGNLQRVSRWHVRCTGHDALHRHDRRIALCSHVEVSEQIVDQQQLRVAVQDPPTGAVDEHVERTHAHRQWQHHGGETRHPAPSDDGDQLAARWPEDRHVVARHQASCLQGSTHRSCVVVDFAPADLLRSGLGGHRRTNEGDARTRVGREFESLDGRQRSDVGHPPDASALTPLLAAVESIGQVRRTSAAYTNVDRIAHVAPVLDVNPLNRHLAAARLLQDHLRAVVHVIAPARRASGPGIARPLDPAPGASQADLAVVERRSADVVVGAARWAHDLQGHGCTLERAPGRGEGTDGRSHPSPRGVQVRDVDLWIAAGV